MRRIFLWQVLCVWELMNIFANQENAIKITDNYKHTITILTKPILNSNQPNKTTVFCFATNQWINKILLSKTQRKLQVLTKFKKIVTITSNIMILNQKTIPIKMSLTSFSENNKVALNWPIFKNDEREIVGIYFILHHFTISFQIISFWNIFRILP